MELRYILGLARRWGWLVLLGAALGAGLGWAVTQLLPPTYQAQATILLNQSSTPAGQRYEDLLTADRLGKTYADLIVRRDVLQQAIIELNLPLTSEDLAKRSEAAQIRETQLLEVRVRDSSATQAADLANRLATVFIARLASTNADSFKTRRERLQSELTANETAYQTANIALLELQAVPAATRTPAQQAEITRLSGLVGEYQVTRSSLLRTLDEVAQAEAGAANNLLLIERAIPPERPVFPIPLLNIALGLVGGLGLASVLAWLLQQLDDRLRTPAAAGAALGLPVLGTTPAHRPGPPVLLPVGSPAAEAYRYLRTNLDYSAPRTPGGFLLLLGATAGDDAATVAVNLAAVAAAADRRVLLVEADLHTPRLHTLLGLPNTRGLGSLADDGGSPPDPVPVRSIPHLDFLAAGPAPTNPADLLGSAEAPAWLRRLGGAYHLVLVVAPPVAVASDGLILAAGAAGVLLVLDAPTARRSGASAAVAALNQVHAPLLGLVLDRAAGGEPLPLAPPAPRPAMPVGADPPGRRVAVAEADE